MFNNNLFNQKNIPEIPEDVDIIFVSDLFIENHLGGAELTSEALIESCPFKIHKLLSSDISMEVLEKFHTKYWIFGNFASMDWNLIPTIVANMKYSILEFDYKYCKYRSPEKHEFSENKPCDCENGTTGKIISAFYYGAKSLWWMSEMQMQKYHSTFPFLAERDNVVLSSVFNDEFFATVRVLNERYKDSKNENYIVVNSNSWIKGVPDAVEKCKSDNLQYELVTGLPYKELLTKLAQSKGLVFLPKGGDTCPRLVIEAKLLGCDLILNDNVQHKDELWFNTDDMLDTESYLYAARNRFWNGIKYNMNYNPTISGYTTTKDCIDQKYPFVESINSLLGFCDEVVIVDGGSTDGTWEKLQEMSGENEKIIIHQEKRDWESKRFAVYDGLQKAVARSICTKDFCWQQDVDEIVHEEDYSKIETLVKDIPKSMTLLALPVVEYWGKDEKVRVDVNPWKWRLSRNLPHITHGIPARLRKFDDDGQLYSLPGSDGCDYVRSDSFEPIPFSTFYTSDVDNLRNLSWSDQAALNSYEDWINQIMERVPGVHHYSWFDIERKIKTYKGYWSKHWQSLYDIKQDDTADNNMFFNKKWSEVSDKDIKGLASKLEKEMGGWIFHSKVDFNRKSPHVKLKRSHPEVMKTWLKKNK